MPKKEQVSFEIRHKGVDGVRHYTDRKQSICCGLALRYDDKNNVIVVNALHSKGQMTGVGLCISAPEIDRLIDELTKMREDIIIANL